MWIVGWITIMTTNPEIYVFVTITSQVNAKPVTPTTTLWSLDMKPSPDVMKLELNNDDE
jgi:hypothetical protein